MEEFLNGINGICYAQAEAKGVNECIVDPVLDDYYMGDAIRLQQRCSNIISNAVKFTTRAEKSPSLWKTEGFQPAFRGERHGNRHEPEFLSHF